MWQLGVAVCWFLFRWFTGFVRCPWCDQWLPLWNRKKFNTMPWHCKRCGRGV